MVGVASYQSGGSASRASSVAGVGFSNAVDCAGITYAFYGASSSGSYGFLIDPAGKIVVGWGLGTYYTRPGNPYCFDTDVAEQTYEMGCLYAKAGDYNNAIGKFVKFLELRGDAPEAYFNIAYIYEHALKDAIDSHRAIPVEDILEFAAPYIHRDYVGDPPLALGTAVGLAKTGISGVAAILPFTCLPGTIVAPLSSSFRKDHDDMPWVDIAFDGQEDTGIETRLQAFVHQAKEYAKAKGYNEPVEWN